MENITSNQLVSSGTQFGAGGFGGLSTDQKITVYNKLRVKCARAQVTLKDFSGNISVQKNLVSRGLKSY